MPCFRALLFWCGVGALPAWIFPTQCTLDITRVFKDGPHAFHAQSIQGHWACPSPPLLLVYSNQVLQLGFFLCRSPGKHLPPGEQPGCQPAPALSSLPTCYCPPFPLLLVPGHPGQHLPPGEQAGGRPGGTDGGAALVHQLAERHADRLGGFPGVAQGGV